MLHYQENILVRPAENTTFITSNSKIRNLVMAHWVDHGLQLSDYYIRIIIYTILGYIYIYIYARKNEKRHTSRYNNS